MNKKIILTSIFAIGVTGAAHAITETSTFSQYMQEDTRYLNAANETNVGTDGGDVTAYANYDWNMVTVPAGKYLPANTDGLSANLANCTEGNFCPGLQSQVHYETTAQGLTSCSTTTSGAYTLSAAGASLATQCYRTCSGNVNIANAATVIGNDYYNTNLDTCEAGSCNTGYHKWEGNGLLSSIGTDLVVSTGAWITNAGVDGNNNASTYGISGNNAFAVDFGAQGVVKGRGRCSTSNTGVGDTDATGQNGAVYCFCQLEGFKASGGNMTTWTTPSPWVLSSITMADAAECAYKCSQGCAESLYGNTGMTDRVAMLGSVAGCVANTYIITWADTLPADVTTNEAGTATYGGNINTPVRIDPAVFQTTQKGKRFIGWTFQQQSQTPSVQDPS